MRARESFGYRGRNHELLWVAQVFVPTKNIKLGYINKNALAQWEKDRINETAAQSGIPEVQPDNDGTIKGASRRNQSEAGSGEKRKEAEES